MIVLVPDPEYVILPGVRVIVHDPTEGNPFSSIVPVEIRHVGLVIVPITGAEGIGG